MTTRVGPEIFARLPHEPGVYFFYDAAGKLLYIGQSLNLRARVTSYRHVSPERHPRRILRLVHRIARIEWQTCETAEAAIELERVLLLQHRPPFNRAGTWQAPPWYLHLAATEDELRVLLARATTPFPKESANRSDGELFESLTTSQSSEFLVECGHASSESKSPLPLSRIIHATLCRCLFRCFHPDVPLSHFPAGLLNLTAPLELRLPFPGQARGISHLVTEYLTSNHGPLIDALAPLTLPAASPEQSALAIQTPDLASRNTPGYWADQVETLQRFAERRSILRSHPHAPSEG